MPTNDDESNIDELRGIVKILKNNKAADPDDIPAEIWKAIAADDDALQHLVLLCNQCWHREKTPQSWHKASVVTIFKKGSAENMSNYRPISLLQISYKIFAALILKRLKDADAEGRI